MRTAVITGASSGLGEVFARQLGARGWNLILAARRADRLEASKASIESASRVDVECFPCDLASTEEAGRLAAHIARNPAIELLVNNAGFGTQGSFDSTDFQRQLDMVSVHVLATMRLTRAVLPGFIARGRGGVINVSSVAAFFRSAGNASYCATKGWMNDFSEALRIELDARAPQVTVQALCPGFTYTEFHDTLGVDRGLVPKWLWMPADFVVEQSLKGLQSGKLFVIPGWKYRWGVALSALLPTAWRVALERASPHKRKQV